MKKLLMIFIVALLAASPYSTASASSNDAVTRGQFFKMVVDHLGYDIAKAKAELPKDVPANSPYADVVKILKDKKIVVGFGDGTVRPNDPIKPAEAATIVSRLLVLKGDAKAALAENYGITFDNEETLSLEKAQEIINKALTSDQKALEIVEQMTVAQNEQTSFKATAKMAMDFKLKEGQTDIPELTNGMKMDTNLSMTFHKEKGMHQQITIAVPDPMTNELQNMTVEQYFVPEGMFMKVDDPETGEAHWLDMSAGLPFSFAELMKTNEESMQIVNEFNRQYFFYRDLGMEVVNGANNYKLAFQGKIHSLEDMLGMLGTILNDQSDQLLVGLENMPNIAMEMTGYIWVDEKTKLPTRQTCKFVIVFGQAKEPGMDLPIESIQYDMDMNYSAFNEVQEIVLPEEAKNAEKLPGFEEPVDLPQTDI
ncbi:S-layer homology domain-containing protein [Calidifontibacillus erzurumensis]|uniref:S-layer homology domain-containing protein n=1 Tax=Calidifontibacillus erzurumensis TaxID=2741433 RepID=A0A8J8GCN1_9BACI|nr:S-layer homology domain-containing protein [Calidifontibacillus erzurumensis]NSL51379.1 S-layer homology domain-containing protein [Calidifontibacillus erzurumensis]